MPTPAPTAVQGTLGDVTAVRVTVLGTSLSLEFHPIAFIAIVALIALAAIWLYRRNAQDRVVILSVDIPLGGIGRLTLNADREVARLAHQAWVEISTRKAGVALDEENDVVEEVLNSWYELFRELRAIAKSVPPPSLRTKNARLLVATLVDVLNKGLRPPLTRWQARYRTWYVAARAARPGVEPQLLQRHYPAYEEMMVDLRKVNSDLRAFASALYHIAQRAQEAAAEADTKRGS